MPERGSRRRRNAKGGRLGTAGRTASTAVREAASVLEQELAATLPGVRRLQERFTKEGRVDQKEFTDVLERARATSHEFINLAADRMTDLRSADVQELSQRLTSDAHDLFDSMINLVALAPDIMNRLAGRATSVLGTEGPGAEGPIRRSRGRLKDARSRGRTSNRTTRKRTRQ